MHSTTTKVRKGGKNVELVTNDILGIFYYKIYLTFIYTIHVYRNVFYRPDGHGAFKKSCTRFCLLIDTKSISIRIYIVYLYCSILEKERRKG